MFTRSIIESLKEWKQKKDRKPLILRGARQVGKTTAVRMFAEEFEQFIYLNLEKDKDKSIFTQISDLTSLINAIYFENNMQKDKQTLIFIDEIQNSPEAIAMIRYFYEEAPHIFILAAGSLLETMMSKSKISFPVGRVEYMFMYPLSFLEFLNAVNEQQALEQYQKVPVTEFALRKITELFHTYTLLGGMPEIISRYSETEDLVALTPLYQGLLTSYLNDVSKYAPNPTMDSIIRYAIEASPLEAGKRIKFQGFGKSNYRSREMGEALRTLERSMLIHLIYPTTQTQLPIMPDLKKSPRLQFLDTGLINFYAGLQSFYLKKEDLHSFYQGFMAEHITGQELIALDVFRSSKISFWVKESNQSNAEIDFVIPFNEKLIPVEVKSGKSGTLRSLHEFINMAPHKYAVRLYSGELNIQEFNTPQGTPYKLLNLPYCLAGKIYDYLDWFID